MIQDIISFFHKKDVESSYTGNINYVAKCGMLDKGTLKSKIISTCVILILSSGSLHYTSVVYLDFNELDLLDIVENVHWGILYFTTAQMAHQMYKGSKTMVYLNECISYGIFSYSPQRSKNHKDILNRAQSKLTFLARLFELMTFGGAGLQFGRAAFFNPKRTGWDLFYKGWLPFEVNSYPTYYIGNGYQLVVAIFICLSVVGFVNSFIGIAEHFLAQLKILKDVLKNIVEFAETPEDVENILKLCIKQQQTIYKLFDMFQNYLSYILFWMFINIAFMLATVGFLLTDKRSTPELILSFVMILTPELLIPFTFCWYGQKMYDDSSSITDAINEMKWYRLHPRHRKILVIILIRCQRPITLTGGGLKKYSLETYQEILSSAYNLLTMLRVVRT